LTPASSSTAAQKKAKRMGDTIVGRFLKALFKSDHDRWNIELRAPKCAPAVALGTPDPLQVEEE
jgi:hypothetical protein